MDLQALNRQASHALQSGDLAKAELVDRAIEATALARDPGRLRGLREKLAANRAAAPLFDTPGFTRGLEAAYETMLKEKR